MTDTVRCAQCGSVHARKAHFCPTCGPGALLEAIVEMPRFLAAAVVVGSVVFFALRVNASSQDISSAAGVLSAIVVSGGGLVFRIVRASLRAPRRRSARRRA